MQTHSHPSIPESATLLAADPQLSRLAKRSPAISFSRRTLRLSRFVSDQIQRRVQSKLAPGVLTSDHSAGNGIQSTYGSTGHRSPPLQETSACPCWCGFTAVASSWAIIVRTPCVVISSVNLASPSYRWATGLPLSILSRPPLTTPGRPSLGFAPKERPWASTPIGWPSVVRARVVD